jgi:hypothetical protein
MFNWLILVEWLGLVTYVVVTEKRARKRAHDERQLRRLLHTKFDTRETDIIRYQSHLILLSIFHFTD